MAKDTFTSTRQQSLREARDMLDRLDVNLAEQGRQLSAARDIATHLEQVLQSSPCTPASPLICSIDLEIIHTHDGKILALPCGHVFHEDCIQTWLREQPTCPIDRSYAYANTEGSNRDEDHHQHSRPDSPVDSVAGSLNGTTQGESDSSAHSSSGTDASNGTAPDPALIERLAFHHRLIAELELLVYRAERLMERGDEVELNERWKGFLQAQIDRHEGATKHLEDELLESTDEE